MSAGNEEGTEDIKDGRCGNADHPGRHLPLLPQGTTAMRQSALGGMYNPVYFNYGIAIHGAPNVPNEPASHGCIRINNYLAESFPDLIHNASGTEAKPKGDQVYVSTASRSPRTTARSRRYFDTALAGMARRELDDDLDLVDLDHDADDRARPVTTARHRARRRRRRPPPRRRSRRRPRRRRPRRPDRGPAAATSRRHGRPRPVAAGPGDRRRPTPDPVRRRPRAPRGSSTSRSSSERSFAA